ncbi:DUF3107 domain-containing protein [Nocardioides caldifontis]|uniref:DUF3107 domain-containing protein n=1 Tax=Nocardioides caldifontis TaxID=2588938 RepID=UPI0011DF9E3D|nr:DUF3107 domain-containing protein [Nocardioides caldifontis]
MEVKIGVQHAQRELVIDTELSGDDVAAEVSKALNEEGGVLSLSDSRGRRILVPSAKLAYVELGTPTPGQVGFRS